MRKNTIMASIWVSLQSGIFHQPEVKVSCLYTIYTGIVEHHLRFTTDSPIWSHRSLSQFMGRSVSRKNTPMRSAGEVEKLVTSSRSNLPLANEKGPRVLESQWFILFHWTMLSLHKPVKLTLQRTRLSSHWLSELQVNVHKLTRSPTFTRKKKKCPLVSPCFIQSLDPKNSHVLSFFNNLPQTWHDISPHSEHPLRVHSKAKASANGGYTADLLINRQPTTPKPSFNKALREKPGEWATY